MRWTEALEALPIETRAQFINGLSIGFGWVALAAKRAARDASLIAVQDALAAAHRALGRSLQLLVGTDAGLESSAKLVPPMLTGQSPGWRVFVSELTRRDAETARELLEDTIQQAVRAGEAIRADGLADGVVAEIRSTQVALARLSAFLLEIRPRHG